MRYCFHILIYILFVGNLTAQQNSGSVPNNTLDSIELKLDRPRRDGDIRKQVLFVINGIFIAEKEGNPLDYFSPNEIETMKVFHFVNEEKYSGVVFIKTKEGIRLPKKIQKIIRNAGKAEYVIFDE